MATGTLTGSTIASTYKSILKVKGGANTVLDADPQLIEDGDGNDSVLGISTDSVLISGSGTRLDFNTDGSGEYLSGDGTDLTIASGSDIHLTATNDINIPVNVGLRFGDGGENIETDNTDFTITSGAKLNLTATSDVHIANATGLVVGHTAQETISIGDGSTDLVPEVQVLGTAQADASLMLAAFSATATSAGAPLLALVKSGDAAIDGTHVIVTDGEELGNIIAYGDDGVDLESPAASIQFEVDGTPGAGDMPGRILFNTSPDGGSVLTERVRISQDGTQNQQGNYIVNEQGRNDHVANTMPAPYYRFDGVNDLITVTDNASLDFGTGDFSIHCRIKVNSVADNEVVVDKHAASFGQGWGIYLEETSGQYTFFTHAEDGSSNEVRDESGTLCDLGVWYDYVATYDRSGNAQHYLNGVEDGSASMTSVGDIDNGGNLLIGKSIAGLYTDMELSNIQIFNLALTATEVKELSSGASVPFKYKGANQTDLASGWDFTSGWATSAATVVDANTFRTNASTTGSVRYDFGTKGKRTRIRIAGTTPTGCTVQVVGVDTITIHSGDLTGTFDSTFEFLNIDTGYRIRCINTIASTKDTDITTFTITEIGAVAEYDGSGVGKLRWDDKSGNDLHGTVCGATVENAPADADSGLTYEEGTWTPTIIIETGSNFSYDSQVGRYTKIGRLVHVQAQIQIDKTAGTNNLSVASFPFTCGVRTDVPILISNYSNSDGVFFGGLFASGTVMYLGHVPEEGYKDASNNAGLLANTTNITIDFNFSYVV